MIAIIACFLSSFLLASAYQSPTKNLPRERVASNRYRRLISTPYMSSSDGEKPVSIRGTFLANSRNLLISLSVVALTTASKSQQSNAETEVLPDAIKAEAAPPAAPRKDPLITHKVYLDIKIANYTEESTGTNKGADGSGRVTFGLYGKDAPDSVARVRLSSMIIRAIMEIIDVTVIVTS